MLQTAIAYKYTEVSGHAPSPQFVPGCPLDHEPNADTIAAIEEGEAMLAGKIPTKWMTLDELMNDLKN